MKRKVPHIILRFSKQVPANPAPAAPSEISPPGSAFATMTEGVAEASADLANPMARESSENEGAGARNDKRNRSVQNKYNGRNNSTQHPDSTLTTPSPNLPVGSSTPQLIGKRKRFVPKSIGGGKGDLQPPRPPQKKARRSTASTAPTAITTTPTPNSTKKKEGDKRVTRSQDTQQKSELAEWFEDRDEDDDFVDIDAQMIVMHHDTPPIYTQSASKTRPNSQPNGNISNGIVDLNHNGETHPPGVTIPEVLGVDIPNPIPSTSDVLVQTIDLESEVRSKHSRLTRFTADPLADDLYIKPHRGMGREEKRLRNVERDKAAYDKQRYEERLEKLRGGDWIKTFNLGGVAAKLGNTEMEKRRQVVIRWHESLLEKFRAWKEEERRQKAAKGGRLSRSMSNSQERGTAESEDPNGQAHSGNDDEQADEEDIYAVQDDSDDAGDNSYRFKQHRHTPKSSKGAHRNPYAESPKKKQPEVKPFTSFYDKPHMRLAAISTQGRKSSRNLTAFGEPLPEFELKEFTLPEEFFQQTARHTRARRRVSK